MAEFDKTKRSIGVNNLDDKARKEMFNKFQSAGGKVVSEKDKKKEEAEFGRQPNIRQGQRGQVGGKNSPSRGGTASRSGRGGGSVGGPKGPSPRDRKVLEDEMGNFINRLSVRVKCWLGRVTGFSSPDLLPTFLSDFNLYGKKSLLELNFVGNDILGNPTYAGKIAKELDAQNPIYIELLGRMHKLYDNTEVNQVLEPHNAAPDLPVAISRIKDPLYSIFKKLYYVYPFQGSYVKALNLGYSALEKLEGKPTAIYNTKKKRALQEFDYLFGTLFEKLYLVVLRSENKNIPLLSNTMESVLGILPEEKPGHRQQGEELDEISGGATSEEDGAPVEEKKEETNPEDSLSKELKYGLKLMRILPLDQLRKKHDPRGEYEDILSEDKAFLTWLFFKEFDAEYSFVMTTKKIEIKPTIVNGAKVDYREKMIDHYETTRASIEQFRIYDQYYKELKNHLKNPGANYIEASKKTSALETKKSQQSRNVRVTVKEFVEKTAEILEKLITDMKSKKEIVTNMDEIMTLDMMESKRRLNKKPIKQCIMEAYCFAIAFAGRLESGDLFGGVTELSPEEMEKEFGIKTEQSSVNESDLGIPGGGSSGGSEKLDSDSLGVDPSILGD
ncbi:hypothetical protein [Leptospira borgpetersenii]|uniref:Uncharacterized protein n=1 Tax=Leptospira borgpetersenii serovar Ballum TaxID=280505 RepID=A0A0E3B9L5_LEPBO|nr:hypothetical protein [Leptospira borgpetersenii]ALO26646.1 hypothetical protein LBBP_02400 [Leptospira borgpetersenii serovar Ballum]ANH01211.2 Uncharacterized protein LB4E_1898 [Leptospira borgpetersenii str. 4E]EKQ99282.1 hypothetical protein LEP1GSC121_2427 [Leptospira borgpetersenii serovar Castellonis str. 200801910]KGE25272.1 hypothetical protein IQ66_05315 [Leptospira borgpetersenii serovar Ballum]MBE8161827.1 hypothetical protein [Leptospira borgpetersenii serovar Ballum]